MKPNNSDMKTRIFISLFILVACRFGTYVPIPGFDFSVAKNLIDSSSFFGVFDVFSGGAFGRTAIFSLSVMPYIVSSIVIQLLSVAYKDGFSFFDLSDKSSVDFYTKILSVFISFFQAIVFVFGLETMDVFCDYVATHKFLFRVVAIFTLVGGTVVLVWLGDRITSYGLANGVSLIIFVGIVAELGSAFSQIISLGQLGKSYTVILAFISVAFLFWFVVFVERSFRKVPVQYPKRQMGKRLYNSSYSHIPMRINVSGVMPPIFASAILMLPITCAGLYPSYFSDFVLLYLSPGTYLYMFMYFALIMFFCFFYSSMTFNVKEITNSLKRGGGFVIGIRPGPNTANYLSSLSDRLTLFGGLYLGFVCVLPEFVRSSHSIPFVAGGTSILIIVGVVNDVYSNVHSHMLSRKYGSMNKFSSDSLNAFLR